MFTAQGLFKGIPCPEGQACRLPNCIFSHELKSKAPIIKDEKQEAVDGDAGGDKKRVKLNNGAVAAPVTKHDSPDRKPFVGILSSKVAKAAQKSEGEGIESLQRPISPPKATNGAQKKTVTSAKAANGLWIDFSIPATPKEELNPRLVGIGSNCAPHNTRMSLLRLLHAQMTRLDGETSRDADATIRSRVVHPENLVQLALDEEQRTVKISGPNYRVTMGHTLVKYKNMHVKDWLAFLDSKTAPPEEPKPTDPFSTELGLDLERVLLSRYITNTTGLDKYGYILEAPTAESIAKTQEAVEKSDNWETCDRCGTRFQIFPNRREDGALTSGNMCRHHWGRAYKNKDTKERIFSCCGAAVGQPGCSTHDTHVFKTSDPTRLAHSLQFETTPDNPRVEPNVAVSFDCEMGYTTLGMEMIRVSAVLWPSNERLIDTLVRPQGHILDLNTRFSGVSSDQFLNAVEYTPPLDGTFTHSSIASVIGKGKEPILLFPAIARALLFSFISPTTPLIGHSIDNDLNVMRIIHPTIIDTVIMYPFPQGFPYRYGLKRLAKEHLMRDIQTAGAEGHDSMEDARATGDLVRAKLAREWVLLKSLGWKIHQEAHDTDVGEGEQVPRKTLLPSDGWVEKGAGKAYLAPRDKWWLSNVAEADEQTTGANTAAAPASEGGRQKKATMVKKRVAVTSSPLVKKK